MNYRLPFLFKGHNRKGGENVLIVGYFNVEIWVEITQDTENGRCPYGISQRKEREEKLLELCLENNLTITTTLFREHPRRLYTWTSPDAYIRNQIDYFLTQLK